MPLDDQRMLPTSAPSNTRCGTGSAINVMQLLRMTSLSLLPPVPNTVVNHARGIARSSAGRTELAALADGLARELIDWGTSIGFTRALQHAERLLPGVSLPWVAYQAFSSLSDARRGQFTRAMQVLPLTAIAPAALLDAMGKCVRHWLPGVLVNAPDHHDVVLGLALCGLLHTLTRQGDCQRPRTDAGHAMLQGMARLRAGLNLLGAVRHIANRTPLPAVPESRGIAGPRLSAPDGSRVGHPEQNSTLVAAQALMNAFPVAAQRYAAASVAVLPSSGGWPLPGADAGRGKKTAAKIPSRPATPSRPSNQRRTFTVRRGGTTSARHRQHRPSMAEGDLQRPANLALSSNGVGAHAAANAADGKDSIMSPAGARKHDGGRQAPARNDGSRNAHGRGRDSDGSAESPDNPLAPGDGNSVTGQVQHRHPAGPTALHAAPLPVPECTRFHHVADAVRQVIDARFNPAPLRFCVHRRAAPLFQARFGTGHLKSRNGAHWIVPACVHEAMPDALRAVEIRQLSQRGETPGQPPDEPMALDHDEIYVIPTVSAVSSQAIDIHNVRGNRILSRNSFKLIKHEQLGGAPRLFIAYFINRSEGEDTGVRAGFVEIQARPHNYTAVDPGTGFVFSSDTLDDLVSGLETVSGCRFRPDADTLPLLQRPRRGHLPLTAATHLFVREEALAQDTAPYARHPFNPSLEFFAPVHFQFRDGLINGVLFRNCFTLVGGSVVFVDRQGQLGTLQFAAANPDGGIYTLQAHAGFEAQLIREHGLQEGASYRMQEVAEILENYGLTGLPSGDTPVPSEVPRLDGFHVGRHAVAGHPVARTSFPAHSAMDPPSTFMTDDRTLRYTDHDGRQGILHFHPADAQGRSRLHVDAMTAGALEFGRRNGIEADMGRAMGEIIALLNENGFVDVTGHDPALHAH